jgi:hemerythrin-like domain-containing protein
MRRSEALKSLSRDHHHGLVAAQGLRRAAAAEASSARATFLEFWLEEGKHHFEVEESVLLPRVVRYVDADHDAVTRVLTEHVELRRRALDLEAGADPPLDLLQETGELLERHIRHEERVLFPLIERSLPDAALTELAQAVEKAEHGVR